MLPLCLNCHFQMRWSKLGLKSWCCTRVSDWHPSVVEGHNSMIWGLSLFLQILHLKRSIVGLRQPFYQLRAGDGQRAFLLKLTQMLGSVYKGILKGMGPFLPAQLLSLAGSWAWIFMAVKDHGWHLFGTSSGQTCFETPRTQLSFLSKLLALLASLFCFNLTRQYE